MRKHFVLLTFLFISFCLTAQTKREKVPYNGSEFGEGATLTTTVSTEENLSKVLTREIRDNRDALIEKRTWIFEIDGKIKIERTCYDHSHQENPISQITIIFDAEMKMLSSESSTYVVESKIVKTKKTSTRTTEGGLEGTAGKYTPAELKRMEEGFKESRKIVESDKVFTSGIMKSACGEAGICKAKLNIFAGPSVLFADHGQDKETFIGGHVFAVYNFTPRIGAGIDGSLHYKNIGDQKLTRSFLLARGQYTFNNIDNCDQKFVPDVHILAGLGFESFKYTFNGNTTKSSGNGFAFGAGAGFNIRLTKTVGIGGSVDYIGVKYKNNDDVNSNVRASLGAAILFWEKMFSDKPQIVY